jgi:hypothetical protein
LALLLEDALFEGDLNETQLRVARLIIKLSLRCGRTTTPPMLQKDFGLGSGISESHIKEALGWLLADKIIERERGDVYRPNANPATWLVGSRVAAAWKQREAELLSENPEFWDHDEIRAGDPGVAFPDATTDVAGVAALQQQKVPKFGSRESSEIRKSTETPTYARVDSLLIDRQIVDSYESGSCAPPSGSDRPGQTSSRFRDEEKNYLMEELYALDQDSGELKDETCRRTWLGRLRDSSGFVIRAVAVVKENIQDGKKYRTPLGKVYVEASKLAKAAGKTLHLW